MERVANGVPSQYDYLVPNANSPAVLSVPAGGPRGLYPSRGTWAPRAGFAYSINDKTVLRGGFGLFYDRIQGNPTFYSLANPPYVSSVSYNYGNMANIAGGKAPAAPFASIQTIQNNLKTPYSEQFSFGVQRDLPLHLFFESEYVGTLGRHLLVGLSHGLKALPIAGISGRFRPSPCPLGLLAQIIGILLHASDLATATLPYG